MRISKKFRTFARVIFILDFIVIIAMLFAVSPYGSPFIYTHFGWGLYTVDTFCSPYAGYTVILLIVGIFFSTLPLKLEQKVIEKWGTYAESKSGIVWRIAREYHYTNEISKKDDSKDSREPLEELGFTILGVVNDTLYHVEPPLGWRQDIINDLHTHIYDEKEQKRLHFFFKNDIMNINAYRTYITATTETN